MNKVHFSSLSVHWATPKGVYDELNKEFKFNHDPCPLGATSGLESKWGTRNYINPPYGRGVYEWVKKASENPLSVVLLPARTDTKWFHEIVLPYAKEIRFIKGRLKFGGATNSAPFPSMVVVFK
jgi:site-specific DNA-methyltransferase (adenine-specific)